MDRGLNTGDRRTDGSSRPLAMAFLSALTISALAGGTASGQEYPLPQPKPLPQLSPPPLVRIVGGTTRRGAKITRLSVRTPVGSTIVSKCVARNRKRCPYRQKVLAVTGALGTRTVHIDGFERTFRAGVVLELYIVKAGRTGKFTSFTIRLRRTPLRRDRCVSGLTLTQISCPAT